MTRFRLGINTCFAVKRWPEPAEWASIVRDEFGLDIVQHSLDLVDVPASRRSLLTQAEAVAEACADKNLILESTFTGLAAYSSNMLLDCRPEVRSYWEAWYRRAIRFTAAAGAGVVGGHVGAFSVSDWRHPVHREERWQGLKQALHRLAGVALDEGLLGIYVENLASEREPCTMGQVDDLLTVGDNRHVPLILCLDIGHQCAPNLSGADSDPYAWLCTYASRLGAVQLQQTTVDADHHWPFIEAHNQEGRVDAIRVLNALDEADATCVTLLLEIIPPSEQADDAVRSELRESVQHWRTAIEKHTESHSNSVDSGPPQVNPPLALPEIAGIDKAGPLLFTSSEDNDRASEG